jgi:hypothetical protein
LSRLSGVSPYTALDGHRAFGPAVSRSVVRALRDPRIVRHGVSVPAGPAPFARRGHSGRMTGLFATVSFDRFVPESSDSPATYVATLSPDSIYGPTPFGASRDGPPAPDGLEQPFPATSRCLAPFVAGASTACRLPEPASSWVTLARPRRGARRGLTCGAEVVPLRRACGARRGGIQGVFGRVAIGAV